MLNICRNHPAKRKVNLMEWSSHCLFPFCSKYCGKFNTLFWIPYCAAQCELRANRVILWGHAASIFISLPHPMLLLCPFNITAAIYGPPQQSCSPFIAAWRDHLSLHPPLKPFYLHSHQLWRCQSFYSSLSIYLCGCLDVNSQHHAHIYPIHIDHQLIF